MKIVTCAGFGGSGSSAITDLLKEFNNIESLGDFEFTLAHELDGLSDLEYYLVDNKHRLNCDMAIFRFKELVNRIENGYNLYIKDFKKISYEYISKLTYLTWNGHWHNHELRYAPFMRVIHYKIPTKIQIIANRFRKSNYELVPYFKKEQIYFSSLSSDKFLDLTKDYTRKIVENLMEEKIEDIKILAMDQLVAPNDITRYSRYYDNLKVITIDRDPRDLYLLNKLYWKEGWIPSNNVHKFILWYRKTRQVYDKSNQSNNSMYVQFEDLIYNYDEEMEKIYKFLNINEFEHIMKKKYFNPEKSIKNTKIWQRKEAEIHLKDINLIERELNEFCYKYEKSYEGQ